MEKIVIDGVEYAPTGRRVIEGVLFEMTVGDNRLPLEYTVSGSTETGWTVTVTNGGYYSLYGRADAGLTLSPLDGSSFRLRFPFGENEMELTQSIGMRAGSAFTLNGVQVKVVVINTPLD